MVTMIQIVTAVEMCEDIVKPDEECRLVTPVLSCYDNYTILNKDSGAVIENKNMTVLNFTSSVYYINFTQSKGDYLVTLCDNSSRELYVQGDDDMASMAITFFMLAITGFLIALPYIVGRFSKNDILDMILKRSCWLLAIYLMVMNSSVMMEIADIIGASVDDAMFRYLWIFGWAGYLFMIYIVFKTLLDVINLWKKSKEYERYGDDND